ncbi:cytochrome b/b6 domain-containing protein [Epibacterium sp. Ofav1-8]|uniref:cytochrome b/b6 domain-containing protein n=1 Tax=Epibacterium sp. Ofav1-8 TaxID=2917735 RepID=UPI001EF7105F|nr:cytochrome b/b6 domain-containing protein [Epibacterium sp. Ofav1-8]MCG7622532.1 cytochrome b/b6 domain-containing protein [Epibacterium sp. Ofav1-8]
MSRSNTSNSYGAITKSFHWLTALLILSAFPLGYFANELAHQIQSPEFDGAQATIARATLLFSLHKTVGVAVFFTALLRILWALTQEKPGLLHPDRKLETWAAETAHWVLYGAMVIVPLSGWIHHAATDGFAPIWWPFGQNLPLVPKSELVSELSATVHYYTMLLLGATLLAHVGGALKHHVIDKDSTLLRMAPGTRALPEPPAQSHSALPFLTALLVWIGVIGGSTALFLQSHPVSTTGASGAETARQTAEGSGWAVQDGSLGIEVVQMGSTVSGTFADWNANINFEEPATPGPAGDVEVTITIPSLTLGSVTDQAMGADYFDADTYPTATFTAEIVQIEGEQYEAQGTLTIRDQSVPTTLPFTLTLEGDTATMSGRTEVNRLDFNIGTGTQDEATLGFGVEITVDLTATRAD